MGQLIPSAWQELVDTERDVMITLAIAGPLSGADVHRRIHDEDPDPSTTTHRAIQRLDDKGLIRRVDADDDDRIKLNYVSEAGEEAIKAGVVRPAKAIMVEAAPARGGQ